MENQTVAKEGQEAERWRALADLALPALLLAAPFLNFVRSNDYAVVSAEIAWAFFLLMLAGAACGILLKISRGFRRTTLIALIISLSIDLQMPDIKSVWLLYVFVVAFFLATVLREHITKIVSVMAIAMVATTLVAPDRIPTISSVQTGVAADVANTELDPVIHLIMDEYIGVEGLPAEMHWSESVRESILDTFVGSGFHLYGGAYSQYFNTYNAIGNALNFSSLSLDAAYFDEVKEPYILKQNRHFERLAAVGYRFRVYQSSFLDYCSNASVPIIACQSYRSNSIKYVENLATPVSDKVGLIIRSFGRLSSIRAGTRRLYNYARRQVTGLNLLPYWSNEKASVGPLPALPLLDRIAQDVSESAGGEVFFAHLLLPHSLYMLDESCGVRMRVSDWRARVILDQASDEPNTEQTRDETYQAYVKQLECTNMLLRKFVNDLKRSGTFDSATIIVHGDHGSRINRNWPTVGNKENMLMSDYTDGFPTLFAVKSPDLEPGYSRNRATLSALLAKAVGADGMAPGERGIYFYNGRGKEMTLEAMPEKWFEYDEANSSSAARASEYVPAADPG